jgi:hypothetical protein
MSQYKLTEEILARSVAKTWDAAKLEWHLEDMYESDEPDTCLCGHTPIIELCFLRNRFNDKDALVGNCCVKEVYRAAFWQDLRCVTPRSERSGKGPQR